MKNPFRAERAKFNPDIWVVCDAEGSRIATCLWKDYAEKIAAALNSHD